MTTTNSSPSEAKIMQPDIVRRMLPALLITQAVLGVLYIRFIPLWMPSDERAHMRYLMDLAATGHLHVMQIGDPSYETHQPPLFYAIAALLYLLGGSLPLDTLGYLLRCFCFIFQMLSTVLVADVFRRHLSSRPMLAAASLVFFALNPSLLAISATVSNDSLSFLLTVLAAWILSRNNFQIVSSQQSMALGIVIGLGLACKLTVFPLLLITFYYLLKGGSQLSISQKTVFAVFLLLPTVLLLAPWLLWNHSVYGTWTAASRLYGAGPAYAQHPSPVRDLRGFNFASIVAYHFIPSEFWLNQFKTPLWLKSVMFATSIFSFAGLIVLGIKSKTLERSCQNFFWFCVLFYALHILVVLMLDVLFSAGPVRWAFGCFFAFAFLWCCGLEFLANLWLQKRSKYIAIGTAAIYCASTNFYLLSVQVPHLSNYGLHP